MCSQIHTAFSPNTEASFLFEEPAIISHGGEVTNVNHVISIRSGYWIKRGRSFSVALSVDWSSRLTEAMGTLKNAEVAGVTATQSPGGASCGSDHGGPWPMAKRTFSWFPFVVLFGIVRFDRATGGRSFTVWVRYNLNRMRRRVIDNELVGGFAVGQES